MQIHKEQQTQHQNQQSNNTLPHIQNDTQKNLFDNLSKQSYIVFPTVDRIPSEKIYDAYTKLYDSYKKLFTDKEIALNSLKSEILNNDQQRNYIEILKQTIESSLLKTGLKPLIDNHVQSTGKDYHNAVIEISSLFIEIEKLKSDNSALEVINSNLKSEIELLNKTNNDFKDKIQENLQTGLHELEEAKRQTQLLENEKENLLSQLTEANNCNERLKKALNDFADENNKTNSIIIKIRKNFEDKTKEHVDKYTKTKEENMKLIQLRDELMINNDSLKENKKMLCDKLELYQNEINKLNNEITHLKDINNQLLNDKLTNEKVFQKLQNKISILEQNNNAINMKGLNQIDSIKNENVSLVNEIKQLKDVIKSYKVDNKKLYEHNKMLSDENAKNFYINKENKFYVKFINRIIKYHINDIDVKNILNQIMNINDSAICLEIDKNKIEAKLERIGSGSGGSDNKREKNDNNDNTNTNTNNNINISKSIINDIEIQIKDKFVQLKNLDSQLKQYEKNVTNN